MIQATACFRCEKSTVATIARRKICTERGFHRPRGKPVEHRCEEQRLPVFACADCKTLVVKT